MQYIVVYRDLEVDEDNITLIAVVENSEKANEIKESKEQELLNQGFERNQIWVRVLQDKDHLFKLFSS